MVLHASPRGRKSSGLGFQGPSARPRAPATQVPRSSPRGAPSLSVRAREAQGMRHWGPAPGPRGPSSRAWSRTLSLNPALNTVLYARSLLQHACTEANLWKVPWCCRKSISSQIMGFLQGLSVPCAEKRPPAVCLLLFGRSKGQG